MKEALKTKVAQMPLKPGVYLMKDGRARIIYVGKAKSLRKRVSSYFQKDPDTIKTDRLLARIRDIEYIITDTEKEALILENSLIKKHRPRYNVNLRDDKTYPYIKLNIKDPYPRLEVVRRVINDGSIYFGPFSSALSMRQTLRLVQRLFPLRQCRRANVMAVDRPCLNHQLGRCSAPCCEKISLEDYRALVNEVALFFQGKNNSLLSSLSNKMAESSENLDFETAAWYRDRLNDVKRTLERQKMVSMDMKDQDVVGIVHDRGQALVTILFVRRGVLLGSRNLDLGSVDQTSSALLESMLGQYYQQGRLIPDEILIPAKLENRSLLEDWLGEKKGKKVRAMTPVRGEKKKLVDLAMANAANSLKERFRSTDLGADARFELQKRIKLDEPPIRIEAFDLSHLAGDSPVGAMVVWDNNTWRKSDYRRYKIKTAAGNDDYAMMYEVLSRRLQKDDLPLADLMVLDGGRGQLSMAVAVINDLEMKNPPTMVGLAKGRDNGPDRVWMHGRKNPLNFKPGSPGLLFLMRIRDEAHRFVQAYHHQTRRKQTVRSGLEEIPGIGPAKRKALLTRFKSLKIIKQASVEDLSNVKGINLNNAQTIHRFFHAGE